MKEPAGFRETLDWILSTVGHATLSVEEAASVSGYSKKMVTQLFWGWSAGNKGKRIAAASLARQMCEIGK